jgi:type II secretory ATPase GspE/PulE/Tfp pilus assembly ATPase PilB-like protein
MARRYRLVLLVAAPVAILLMPLADNLLAQTVNNVRGPGGYLSWWKMLLVTLVFLLWVRMADWINRDTMKIGDRINLTSEFWNPLVVFCFLVGFLLAISIPIFAAGFPIYLVAALAPFLSYFFVRRSRLSADPSVAQYLKLKPGEIPDAESLPQDQGAQVDFSPAGNDASEKQANLIRARQTNGFNDLKDLIVLTQFKRTEQMLMDFSRDAVNSRILVDGMWHPLEPMDRETGDPILASMKYLAGLNPADRRGRQSGEFSLKTAIGKSGVVVTSQGVPTGERVLFKYSSSAKEALTLPQLGMFPDMVKQLKTSLDGTGVTIISAPPGSGFTSSWQGALVTADRLTRDLVALIDEDETETVLENIVILRYNEAVADKKQLPTMRAMLLTQPNVVIVPKVENKEVMDQLTLQAVKQDRAIVLRTPAKSAAEAILRLYSQAGDRDQFLQGLKNVTCQRLVRRLCSECKLEVRVQPNVIQQLGGDPKQQQTIFNPWKLPPPEQRVDEKGKEIEFPPCETCGGIGYIGRIGIFEMITLDEQLREFIKKNPKIAPIEQAAVKLGKSPLANQAYQLVLLGVTSINEVQKVLKEQP